MSSAAAAFSEVLSAERQCALAADVDALAALQEQKREALARLLESEATDEEIAELRAQALSNIQLMRHLVSCLQGIVTPAGPTYTPHGARPSGDRSRSWGRL